MTAAVRSAALFVSVTLLVAVSAYVALDLTQRPGRTAGWHLDVGIKSFMSAFRHR